MSNINNVKMISAPPSKLSCPSFSRSPLLATPPDHSTDLDREKIVIPMRRYLEEVGNLTKFDQQDDWLPITESRNGNAFYAAFHTLCSAIGFQALLLPLAFTSLGWTWGIICLSVAFLWQFYTLWLLIQLHESSDGTRYSRYLRLSMAAFGEKLGKVLSLFPIMYLSGGTCVTLIMVGGGTLKTFFHVVSVSGPHQGLTTIECYLIFTCSAILVAQLPNLNSIAWVSFIGAITAVTYCTLIWAVSVSKSRPINISYGPAQVLGGSLEAQICNVLNSLGMIAFAFRGHNLVLEIQGTMQTSKVQPSRLAMWRGVKFSYLIIGLCIFPLAICGYWSYGNLIHASRGMLNAFYEHHGHDTSKALLGLITFLVVINNLSSFQIYAMPVFDNLELRYTSSMNKPCPRWVRIGIRCFFGCLAFFISVALPFLPSLAGLIGGIALPVTLAYPCLMWVKLKKPDRWSVMWCLNWGLGCLGLLLSVVLIVGAVWSIVIMGIPVHFFKPQ